MMIVKRGGIIKRSISIVLLLFPECFRKDSAMLAITYIIDVNVIKSGGDLHDSKEIEV
jgi:hypothetical protein